MALAEDPQVLRQNGTTPRTHINLPGESFPVASFQLLHQAGCLILSMVTKDGLEELQDLLKDSVINSTTVDQGLIISTIAHVSEG